jgi:hypothetical protein
MLRECDLYVFDRLCTGVSDEKPPAFSGQPWMAASKLRSPEKVEEQERAWRRATGVFQSDTPVQKTI